MPLYFCLISTVDSPLFELNFPSSSSVAAPRLDFLEFLVHSSLDQLDQKVSSTSSFYLKTIDKFHDNFVSAFVSLGLTRFLLVHESRVEENNIKLFFQEVHENYVKIIMNPFYEKNSPIKDTAFEEKVKSIGEKYLIK
jgi:hypothetical protein